MEIKKKKSPQKKLSEAAEIAAEKETFDLYEKASGGDMIAAMEVLIGSDRGYDVSRSEFGAFKRVHCPDYK